MVDTALFVGNIATDDAKKVANRIYDIIVSPGIIPGLINGALTVPLDLGYLALGYFDTDSRLLIKLSAFAWQRPFITIF